MKSENVIEVIMPGIIDLMKFVSKYGIKDESVHKHTGSFEIKDPVKFSIPEFWEDDMSSDTINFDRVAKSFKGKCNKVIKNAIKFVDESADDESLDKFLNTIKYTYRVRNGERWTHAEKEETEKRIRVLLGTLQETEYQEI